MTQEIKTVQIAEIIPTKIWIEDDFCGSRHVMIQHQMEGEQPFCYCTFNYNWHYTDNASTWRAAEAMAISLGAVEPIERKFRSLPQEQG